MLRNSLLFRLSSPRSSRPSRLPTHSRLLIPSTHWPAPTTYNPHILHDTRAAQFSDMLPSHVRTSTTERRLPFYSSLRSLLFYETATNAFRGLLPVWLCKPCRHCLWLLRPITVWKNIIDKIRKKWVRFCVKICAFLSILLCWNMSMIVIIIHCKITKNVAATAMHCNLKSSDASRFNQDARTKFEVGQPGCCWLSKN